MKNYILLSLLLLAFISGSAVSAAETECKALKIPVFFVTDRNRQDKGKDQIDFGGERQYRGMCKHDPHIGIAYCVVKNLEKKCADPLWKDLGWETVDTKEGPVGITLASGSDYAEKRRNFWEQVYGVSQKMPSPHEVDLFIPGYMSTFESGLRSAARIAYYSERPVILYSWPSKGKFTAYTSDESTVEWSQEHFSDVLSDLTLLSKRESPLRLRVYAHSMGNRLVMRATPDMKASNAIDEVAMICPDVDAGLVKHYASRYFERRGSTILRLYESNGDKMLRLSKFVHGGYERFGENYEPLDLLLNKAPKTTLAAADAGKTASAAPLQGAVASAVTLPRLPPPPPLYRRLQTIDFSCMDMGTVGHRIPVELICSLSRHNEPSKGLDIIVVKPDHSKLDPNAPKPDEQDGVIKIVSLDKKRKIPLYGTVSKYRPRPTLWITKDWTLK